MLRGTGLVMGNRAAASVADGVVPSIFEIALAEIKIAS
jgi:hypothetical protein